MEGPAGGGSGGKERERGGEKVAERGKKEGREVGGRGERTGGRSGGSATFSLCTVEFVYFCNKFGHCLPYTAILGSGGNFSIQRLVEILW